ncbi:MAG: hypothetical protein EOM24_09180, partial [Chloroflexia bacterium]|nr:hypothetical protein [Chloroflexia bacterium]
NFTCRSAGPGDGVVEVYSATGEDALGRNVYAPKLQWIYKRALDHVAMTDSEQDFLAYVLPILAAGPDRAHERTLPSSLKATAFDAQASPTSSAKPPQVLERVWLELPVGASRNLAITVPAGEALVVTLVASDTVQAQLRTPQGAAADPFTGSLFRSVWASTPITGNWTVALTNTDATTASVVLGAVILEPVEELVVTVGEPAWDGMTFITATLASTNAPQRLRAQTTTGLTLTARLTNEVGDELLVELRDDGRHGDGAADDGVYGARVGPLDPALYDIFVYALGPDFYRGTTAGVHVPFARIAKTVTPEHPVTQGDPLTYTLVISGPAGATVGLFDPLEDLDFVRFLVQPPGVLYTNGALTGTITLPTTTPVSVTFVATAAVPELADLVTLSNHACVYPATGSVDDCVWSPAVTTDVHVGATTHAIYLPLMLHDYTPRLALTLAYGTYFGGVDEDQIKDIAIGPDGFLYLTGATYSTKPGPDSLGRSYSQVFVAKLTPDGKTLVYYQQFGGTADSGGKALAVDAAGNVYVTGYTQSATFPRTAGAFDQDFNGGADLAMDAFVTKLDATGNIVYSSYLGGSGYDIPGAGASGGSDRGTGIAVLGEYVYVIGWTESSDFPTTPGAYDQVYADADWGLNTDLFIVKLSLGGQGSADLVYGTFLGGGASFEEAADLAIDNAGRLYITGSVEDQLSIGEFPLTPGAVDTIPPAGWQVKKAFLIVFNPVGGGQSDLIYSTYLGGTDRDEGHALALGSDGTVYLTGRTASLDFPTTDGAFDRACGTNSTCNEGRSDAFVTWINPDPTGSAQDNLRYSTYLGGGGGENFDQGTIALIAPGEVYVAGDTGSLTFPTTSDAYAQERNGTGDLFLARLKLAGQGAADLVYGTYIGGSHYDEASYGLARSSDETVTLVGITRSTDLPVGPEPLYATFNGGYYDGYLFQFGLESVSWRTGPQ